MPELVDLVALTATVLWTQTVNEERLAVAAAAGSGRVMFSAVGDDCPLCQSLDGLIFEAQSDAARRYTPPIHINCDCIWVGIGDDQVGAEQRFTPRTEGHLRPLVERHGHFVEFPERYAELRVPAGPEGRDFTFRRGRIGERGTLVWARSRYPLPGLDPEVQQRGGGAGGPRPWQPVGG